MGRKFCNKPGRRCAGRETREMGDRTKIKSTVRGEVVRRVLGRVK